MKRRFPDHKHQQGQKKEAQGEKARREDEGTEHHQVVPIEDAAGSAAAVFQKEDPERAEEEHTDQVAYIKAYTEQKKLCLSQHPRTVEQTDRQSEEQPQQKDRSGGLVALADERAQGPPGPERARSGYGSGRTASGNRAPYAGAGGAAGGPCRPPRPARTGGARKNRGKRPPRPERQRPPAAAATAAVRPEPRRCGRSGGTGISCAWIRAFLLQEWSRN